MIQVDNKEQTMPKKILPLPQPSLFPLPSSFPLKATSKWGFRWARFPQWNRREKRWYLASVPLWLLALELKKWEVIFAKLGMPLRDFASTEMVTVHWNSSSPFCSVWKAKKMMQICSNVSVLLNKNVLSKSKSHTLKCYFGFMEM